MSQFLKEVEWKYDVSNVRVDGEQAWPYLRIAYATAYLFRGRRVRGTKPGRSRSAFSALGKMLYGFGVWFRQYDYLIFSTSRSNVRKRIEGRYFDRFADPLADELGRDDVLVVEDPEPVHRPKDEVYTEHIASIYPIYFLSKIRGALRGDPKVEGLGILDEIKKEYGLQVDDLRRIRSFRSRYAEYKCLFKRLKPRYIFVVCSYYDMGKVKAAKDLGIRVVEIQHGFIGEGHEAYNIFTPLDRSFYPDYVLVFGEKDAGTLEKSGFIDHGKAYPVGSYYIDYLKSHFVPDEAIKDRLKRFRTVVGVTLQSTMEDDLIGFITECAALDRDVGYVLIPRHPIERTYNFTLPENVILDIENEFYDLIMYADVHSTVYSSCALEAPSLGVRNILVNLNDLSRQYLGNILTEPKASRYVESPEEFIWAVQNFGPHDREAISKLNEDIIKSDYANNLRNALRTITKSPKSGQSN